MVRLLNLVFGTKLIMNDGHEILTRLREGDDLADVVVDLGSKFNGFRRVEAFQAASIARAWPALHQEAVSKMVQWALEKLDDDENRVWISWKGDAEHPETVTRFELNGNRLQIELAHPPLAFA
jgi:hypothetical protein